MVTNHKTHKVRKRTDPKIGYPFHSPPCLKIRTHVVIYAMTRNSDPMQSNSDEAKDSKHCESTHTVIYQKLGLVLQFVARSPTVMYQNVKLSAG